MLLSGCAGDGRDQSADASGCKSAVADAAKATNMPERKERLRPAFEACESLAEFIAAAARYPKALEGIDARGYVREQCREVDALKGSALCDALG